MTDMKFPHLLDSYNERVAMLPELHANFGEDVAKLARFQAAAEETLASYYLANDDQRFREQIGLSLKYWKRLWKVQGTIGAWQFILYSCISLAIEDFDNQSRLLEFEVLTKGYKPVTRDLYKLHRSIFLREEYVPGKSKKTMGEESWFRALTALANDTEPDWSDFDSYWKATRIRRHEFTILQHRNLLKDGMQVLWKNRH